MSQLRVNVLLSSYNGGRFLQSQVQSVLEQRAVDVKITIRDDGSSDAETLAQLKVLANNACIDVHYGENVGVVRSFFLLLDLADAGADYYAFCDQDDCWLPHKLQCAVASLRQINHSCALYCSRLAYVDENLHVLGYSRVPVSRITPANALVENYAAGCTQVFTPGLREMAAKAKNADRIMMHDWWLYIIAAFLGRVVYDDAAAILYRQHDTNLVGGSSSYQVNFLRRLKLLGHNSAGDATANWRTQAEEFHACFGSQLTPHNDRLLSKVEAYGQESGHRMKLIFGSDTPYRQGTMNNLAFKLLLLFKLF